MSINVKPVTEIANKWQTVTPSRTADYESGVKNPRKSWQAQTSAAESSYEAGVQAAVQKKAFGKGVKRAGDARWQQGAVQKGLVRWGAGVSVAGDNYARGFQPYHDAIARTNLPPRFPKRDPRNLERVKAVVTSVSKEKDSQIGKG